MFGKDGGRDTNYKAELTIAVIVNQIQDSA
jgi:hypothetical protein